MKSDYWAAYSPEGGLIHDKQLLSVLLLDLSIEIFLDYWFFNMNNKLYVGNLNFQATEDELNDLFQAHGSVEEVFMPKDKFTGRAKGFAFVTYTDAEGAQKAIDALNEKEFQGRNLVVNVARPKEDRPQFSRNSGNSGGGHRGGQQRRGGDFRKRDRY